MLFDEDFYTGDQYQGVKELYEVVLKAKVPMQFGARQLEVGEPVLYFENINLAMLTEHNSPIMARGGWGNMPHVIWENRSEVRFSLTEGVLSAISMGILLSASMSTPAPAAPMLVPMREGPFINELDELQYDEDEYSGTYKFNASTNTAIIKLKHDIYLTNTKAFLYEYDRNVAQKKVYGNFIDARTIEIKDASPDKTYIIDYYYQYEHGQNATIYTIEKERFNGIFTLEGKFYSKDENEGINYTNLIYMPKVRVVSDISLRLGERADPTTSVFNIIGMPESTDDSKNLILRITRLVTNDED